MSGNTLKTYGYHMDSFYRFTDGEQPVSNVTEQMLDDYTLYLKNERKIKDVTVNSHLRTMRNFLYYCMECGYVEQFKLTVPKYENDFEEKLITIRKTKNRRQQIIPLSKTLAEILKE